MELKVIVTADNYAVDVTRELTGIMDDPDDMTWDKWISFWDAVNRAKENSNDTV